MQSSITMQFRGSLFSVFRWSSLGQFLSLCFFFSFLFSSSSKAEIGLCRKAFEKIGTAWVAVADSKLGHVTFHYLKGTKYPFFAVHDTIGEIRAGSTKTGPSKVTEILRNRWEKDIYHLTFYIMLGTAQAISGISMNAFHQDTSDFDKENEPTISVVIDNMGENSQMPRFGTFLFDSKYKNNPNAILLQDISGEDLEFQLKQISQRYHLPIKIDIYADEEIPNINEHYGLNKEGIEITKIRYNSSRTGRGEEGEFFSRTQGNAYSGRGTKIYSSNVEIHPSFSEYVAHRMDLPRPWKSINTVSDWMFPEFGIVPTFSIASPFSRSNTLQIPENSETRKRFEESWSEKFPLLNQPPHTFTDKEDLEHFTKIAPGLSYEAARGAKTATAVLDSENRISLTKEFDTPEHAAEYFRYLSVDPELMDSPVLRDNAIQVLSKPNVEQILKERNKKTLEGYVSETAASLKTLYEERRSYIEAAEKSGTKTPKEAREEKEKLDAIYHHYSVLTNVYRHPWWWE